MFCTYFSTLVNLELVLSKAIFTVYAAFPKNKKKMKYGNIIAKIYIDLFGLPVPKIK